MGCADVSTNDMCIPSVSFTTIAVPVEQDVEKGCDLLIYNDDGLSNPIEIHISCENLADLDSTSKSDPMAILYEFNSRTYSPFSLKP